MVLKTFSLIAGLVGLTSAADVKLPQDVINEEQSFQISKRFYVSYWKSSFYLVVV